MTGKSADLPVFFFYFQQFDKNIANAEKKW